QAAVRALGRANSPVRIVRHAGGCARIERTERDEYQVFELDVYRLRDELTRAATWLDRKGRPSVPTGDFGRLMLAKHDPPIPSVPRFMRCPVFTREGRLVHQPGWDARSGIYFMRSGTAAVEVASDEPSRDEVISSVDLLLEMLADFPFASSADKTNAIALPLERLVRDMIDGPLPLHLIDASVRGAGKSLLANALLGSIGQAPAIWAEVRDGAEMRKALTSYLTIGREVILIDNVRELVDSGVLAAAITGSEWSDRLLGTNRPIVTRVRNSWILTG